MNFLKSRFYYNQVRGGRPSPVIRSTVKVVEKQIKEDFNLKTATKTKQRSTLATLLFVIF
jgi:hypothetical protein